MLQTIFLKLRRQNNVAIYFTLFHLSWDIEYMDVIKDLVLLFCWPVLLHAVEPTLAASVNVTISNTTTNTNTWLTKAKK